MFPCLFGNGKPDFRPLFFRGISPIIIWLSPGAPPAPVRLSGQNFFEEKFSPFQWTGRWKLATNGGSWQHFYTHLNASKTARIERREDSKTHSVAKIGGNGVFFVANKVHYILKLMKDFDESQSHILHFIGNRSCVDNITSKFVIRVTNEWTSSTVS